jgi:heme-degrading monooxygenase HmoA
MRRRPWHHASNTSIYYDGAVPSAGAIMAFVAINVLSVPPERREVLEQRFARRAGEVDKTPGFQAFELLRPVEGEDRYFVYTRWDSQEAFQAWTQSQAFEHGHAQHNAQGPAASGSELLTFEVAERSERPARSEV